MKKILTKRPILVGTVLMLMLSACNKTEPLPPVDISKLPPISTQELEWIEKDIAIVNQTLTRADEGLATGKRELFFDKNSRVITYSQTHLDISSDKDVKDYINKRYNDKAKTNSISSFCGGEESRIRAKIELKNHISLKFLEKDKDGNEFYSWIISPSEHCRGEVKKLGIQYPTK